MHTAQLYTKNYCYNYLSNSQFSFVCWRFSWPGRARSYSPKSQGTTKASHQSGLVFTFISASKKTPIKICVCFYINMDLHAHLSLDISSIWSTQAQNWKLCLVSPSSSAQSASISTIVASLSARGPAQAIGRDVVNKVRGKNSRHHLITMRVSRWYYHPISGEQNMGILPTCREDQEENVRQAEEQLHKH